MAENHGSRYAQLSERQMDELGLRCWRPDRAPRAIAMSKAGAVEDNDAVPLRRHVEETTGFEIGDHAAIAVQQDERLPFSPLNVVQAHAIHFHKPSCCGIFALGPAGEQPVHDGTDHEGADRSSCQPPGA
jgi:hypothetical protein